MRVSVKWETMGDSEYRLYAGDLSVVAIVKRADDGKWRASVNGKSGDIRFDSLDDVKQHVCDLLGVELS